MVQYTQWNGVPTAYPVVSFKDALLHSTHYARLFIYLLGNKCPLLALSPAEASRPRQKSPETNISHWLPET